MKYQTPYGFASTSSEILNSLLDMQRKNLQAFSEVQQLVFATMQNLTAGQLGLLSQMDRNFSFGQDPSNENPPEEKAAEPETKEQRKKTA